MRRRLALSAALVAVAALTAAVTVVALRPGADRAEATKGCTQRLPSGASIGAAHEATAVFVRTVVLRGQPLCGYALGSERLRRAVERGRWASGDVPVRAFVSRYPPTAYRHASRDPRAPQAVYVISRSPDAAGVSPLQMIVGLAAPDAGLGAYRVVLVLDDDGNWRVDRWWRVRISSRDV